MFGHWIVFLKKKLKQKTTYEKLNVHDNYHKLRSEYTAYLLRRIGFLFGSHGYKIVDLIGCGFCQVMERVGAALRRSLKRRGTM